MLKKLLPLVDVVDAPMTRLDRGLDPHGQDVVRKLSEDIIEYVDHPDFHHLQAETILFAEEIDPTEVNRVWDLILNDSVNKEFELNQQYTFKPKEEKKIFIQYNYARYRVFKLMTKAHTRRLSLKEAQELVRWQDKVIEIRNTIFVFNYAMIFAIGRKMGYMEWSDSKDLVDEAENALFNCIAKFNVGYGWKFSTYAYRSIKRRFYRQAEKLVKRYRNEIRTELKPRYHPVHFDDVTLLDLETVKNVIFDGDMFNDKQRNILLDRLLFGRTLKVIGQDNNLTKERVRQIVEESIEKLRENLVA